MRQPIKPTAPPLTLRTTALLLIGNNVLRTLLMPELSLAGKCAFVVMNLILGFVLGWHINDWLGPWRL